eukprot:TRINITY_DN129_c0_g6_i1.p1 TRINITY_DN129_c0_g6~~TRINITY_DN129_c0_g6_i1.p1  ORF type:complete len:264 (+),score=38.45 TRINITY_DN129_c0_g6_i1:49-792(+)
MRRVLNKCAVLPFHRGLSTAVAKVHLPVQLSKQLVQSGSDEVEEIMSVKGPIFSTSVVGGTMAVKRTAELIPLFTPAGMLEKCDFSITLNTEKTMATISCTTAVKYGNGDMEAMTGATTAALTVYDMCKSVSKDGLFISEIKLIRDSKARPKPEQPTPPNPDKESTERKRTPRDPPTEEMPEPKDRTPKDAPRPEPAKDAPRPEPAKDAPRPEPAKHAPKKEIKDSLALLIERIQKEEAEARNKNVR